MKQLLVKTTRGISRRRALSGIAGTAFGAFAAVSIGKPAQAGVEIAAPCSGPHGTGSCGRSLCNGSNCGRSGPIRCHKVVGYCPTNTPCWTGPRGTCCDCRCHEGPGAEGWWCYCYG